MKPIRNWCPLLATAALTGLTGLAALPPTASAADTPQVSHPPATAMATDVNRLTLSNGTQVVSTIPWAASAGAARPIVHALSLGTRFCFYGGAQSGPPAPAAPASPTKYTLTIRGTNEAGEPDTGDLVQVYSATSMAWNDINIGPISHFANGVATKLVPAGKYWLIGMFTVGNSFRMDIPQQITVSGNTTASVSARAASSEVTTATPQRAVLADDVFSSSFTLPGGQVYEDCGLIGGGTVWVSPLPRASRDGTVYAATSAQLTSPKGTPSPYLYELDFAAPPGSIPGQHFTVTANDLATVHERFYSDTVTTGPWASLGGPARQFAENGFTGASIVLPQPSQRTIYYTARPAAVWRSFMGGVIVATQSSVRQLLHGGQVMSTGWNAYPLHPAPNDLLTNLAAQPTVPAAYRTGNELIVDVYPFSDNTPGHYGEGPDRFNRVPGSGRYAIYVNGVKVASGSAPKITGPFGGVGTAVTIPTKPSKVKFALTESRQEPGSNLSGSYADTWTWPSAPDPHATVPAPWFCHSPDNHHCVVQDMMTTDYALARESLDGSAPAGPQALNVTFNHLELSTPYPVAHARVEVSYDNGTSWQPAALARICHPKLCTNQFRATYTAPAGALVSLRVAARDTNGASVTETILNAYQTS